METSQNKQLTNPINKSKLKQAINQMENGKSQGTDGIPIKFYKTFYAIIENDLLQLYNNILFVEKNTANIIHQAKITLIPKKEK